MVILDSLVLDTFDTILARSNYLEMRIQNILRMRLRGKTLNEIGKSYGLTRERVRQLEARGCDLIKKVSLDSQKQDIENKVVDIEPSIFTLKLSTKIKGALYMGGVKTIKDLTEVLKDTPVIDQYFNNVESKKYLTGLLTFRNIGWKSIKDIRECLKEYSQ